MNNSILMLKDDAKMMGLLKDVGLALSLVLSLHVGVFHKPGMDLGDKRGATRVDDDGWMTPDLYKRIAITMGGIHFLCTITWI